MVTFLKQKFYNKNNQVNNFPFPKGPRLFFWFVWKSSYRLSLLNIQGP